LWENLFIRNSLQTHWLVPHDANLRPHAYAHSQRIRH
jgi:hypothetical protein